jgi:WhiB family redox-sensing transcriptional regulator
VESTRSEEVFDMKDWDLLAACRDAPDPDLWFPVSDREVALAKAECSACPVKADCLGYALDAGLGHGIFGGKTPDERRKLTRRATASTNV